MKILKTIIAVMILGICLCVSNSTWAASTYSQTIKLSPGWNIISTPRLLDSHTLSADEISTNFDIYILDPSQPSKWATMSDLGQTEFQPLYGYFINNKTGISQILTLNYLDDVSPAQRLFERDFSKAGWYSIGAANPTYAQQTCLIEDDYTNSNILVSLNNHYDSVIDLTSGSYDSLSPISPSISDTWKTATNTDLNSIHDLMETKGYAIYINSDHAAYSGFQNTGELTCSPSTRGKLVLSTNANTPPAGYVLINSMETTSDITLLNFDIKASDNYATVNSLSATITAPNNNIAAVKLYDGSTLLRSQAPNSIVSFDNLHIGIYKDSTKTLTLKVDIIPNGIGPISANIDSASISSVDTLGTIATIGSATGNTLTTMLPGPIFHFISATNTVTAPTPNSSSYATGTIAFEMEAKGIDLSQLTNSPGDITVLDINNKAIDSSDVFVSWPDRCSPGSKAIVSVSVVQRAGSSGAFTNFSIGEIITSDGTVTMGGAGTVLENFKTPTVWLQ